jgi:hypothetical protein
MELNRFFSIQIQFLRFVNLFIDFFKTHIYCLTSLATLSHRKVMTPKINTSTSKLARLVQATRFADNTPEYANTAITQSVISSAHLTRCFRLPANEHINTQSSILSIIAAHPFGSRHASVQKILISKRKQGANGM